MSETKPPGSRKEPATSAGPGTYRLEDQMGFAIRKASQRHAAIFAQIMIEELTPTQWAAMVKLAELGAVSQNQLGRETAMDVATIKGVVDRLIRRHFVTAKADPRDGRRNSLVLTQEGIEAVRAGRPVASRITAETCKTLTPSEQRMLLELLRKIA